MAQLTEENMRLKQLVAELTLDVVLGVIWVHPYIW